MENPDISPDSIDISLPIPSPVGAGLPDALARACGGADSVPGMPAESLSVPWLEVFLFFYPARLELGCRSALLLFEPPFWPGKETIFHLFLPLQDF